MAFLKLVGAGLLFVAGVAIFVGLGYKFPQKVKENMEQYYGDPVISTWWALAQSVVLVAFTCEIGNSEEGAFWILLFVMLAVFAAAIWCCVAKAKRAGAQKRDVILSCVAQVCYALGISVTIVLLLYLFFGRSKRGRKKKR